MYGMWILILLVNLRVAFSDDRLRILSRVTLLFYVLNTLQAHAKNLALQYYYLFFLIVVLLMCAIFVDYIIRWRKWVGIMAITTLVVWELTTLHFVYRIYLSPLAVEKGANIVRSDIRQATKKSFPVSLYLDSPTSTRDAYEFRVIL